MASETGAGTPEATASAAPEWRWEGRSGSPATKGGSQQRVRNNDVQTDSQLDAVLLKSSS